MTSLRTAPPRLHGIGDHSGPRVPEFWWARGPREPRAVVLVLPGGRRLGRERPHRLDPAIVRARAFAWSLARAGQRCGLRVEMLRYRPRLE